MFQQNFAERTIWISGAGKGFGQEIARRFFDLGANLVLNDIDDSLLSQSVRTISGGDSHPRIVWQAGDISQEATSIALRELAQDRFGGLDIAINNAGIVQPQLKLEDTPSDLYDKVMAVNVHGVFYAMKQQIPLLLESQARTGHEANIVNLASAAGIMGAPLIAPYAASKHAVVGLTRSAAVENARRGIRINALCPAFAKTDMALNAIAQSKHDSELAEKNMVAGVPMKRLAEISEVVQAVFWLCADENSFYTGQTLSIDGGLAAY